MKITLSKEALSSLPDADSQGIVRVTATLRLGSNGSAELMEVNDSPVGDEEKNDDSDPMKPGDLPDLNAAEGAINDPQKQDAPLY